jgi:hypothetical protein
VDETNGLDTNENSEPAPAAGRPAWQTPTLSRLSAAGTTLGTTGAFSDGAIYPNLS